MVCSESENSNTEVSHSMSLFSKYDFNLLWFEKTSSTLTEVSQVNCQLSRQPTSSLLCCPLLVDFQREFLFVHRYLDYATTLKVHVFTELLFYLIFWIFLHQSGFSPSSLPHTLSNKCRIRRYILYYMSSTVTGDIWRSSMFFLHKKMYYLFCAYVVPHVFSLKLNRQSCR